jgi:flagellar protein FliJ
MKRFEFQFATLLQLRRNARDLLRHELADLRSRLDDRRHQRDHLAAEWLAQLDELRTLSTDDQLDGGASRSRRDYSVRLAEEIKELDNECRQMRVQIDLCRATILRADQGVEALEKLAEKHLTEFVSHHQRHESLQHEEAWQAQRATQAASR